MWATRRTSRATRTFPLCGLPSPVIITLFTFTDYLKCVHSVKLEEFVCFEGAISQQVAQLTHITPAGRRFLLLGCGRPLHTRALV